jgi:ferrochelatase
MYKITENLVKILQKKLDNFFVIYSMRYTEPFAEDVIKKLKEKNIKEVLLFPLYPHKSIATNISSLEDFENKAKKIFKIKKIEAFFENKIYNEKIIEKILEKTK